MAESTDKEGLGIPKSKFSDFLDELRNKLIFMSGKLNCEDFGLELKDVRKYFYGHMNMRER